MDNEFRTTPPKIRAMLAAVAVAALTGVLGSFLAFAGIESGGTTDVQGVVLAASVLR